VFEAAFIDLLAADATLVGLLSTFSSEPAIFSNVAPQAAEPPYIVFDIDTTLGLNRAAFGFAITCDIWHYKESGAAVRQMAERVEYVTDQQKIMVDVGGRFQAIRLFYESGRETEQTDIKLRRYVVSLSARAGRKKWCEQIT